MSNATQQFLWKLWLSDTEIDIFIACSKYPNSAISSISRITKKARTTVHDSIKKLTEEWFITTEKKERWHLYSAIHYTELQWILRHRQLIANQQLSQLEHLKADFNELASRGQSLQNIQRYQWKHAVSVIYEKVNTSNTMRAIYNVDESLKHTNYSLSDLSWNVLKNKDWSKEILYDSPHAREYLSHFSDTNNHSIKFLREEIQTFSADQIITEDAFFYVSFDEVLLWIEITNSTFVEAQKVIFDSLWSRL